MTPSTSAAAMLAYQNFEGASYLARSHLVPRSCDVEVSVFEMAGNRRLEVGVLFHRLQSLDETGFELYLALMVFSGMSWFRM